MGGAEGPMEAQATAAGDGTLSFMVLGAHRQADCDACAVEAVVDSPLGLERALLASSCMREAVRQSLVLHAAAVRLDDGAALLLGPSGTG